MHGWVPNGKHAWKKGINIIRIKPTDSRKPRSTKTIWLIEDRRIGSTAVRLGYCKTYPEGKKIAAQFMRRW